MLGRALSPWSCTFFTFRWLGLLLLPLHRHKNWNWRSFSQLQIIWKLTGSTIFISKWEPQSPQKKSHLFPVTFYFCQGGLDSHWQPKHCSFLCCTWEVLLRSLGISIFPLWAPWPCCMNHVCVVYWDKTKQNKTKTITTTTNKTMNTGS